MELLLIAILLTPTGAQESQMKGPDNTLSFVGSIVTLKCSTSSRNCNGIDWQKYIPDASPITVFKGPGTMLTTNVTDRDRYSVNNSSGCDLVIRNVQLTDAGRFTCSAIISASQITKTAYLIILETQPKCATNASEDNIVEEDGIQLKCMVTYSGLIVSASMAWEGVEDAPAAVNNGETISRSYSVIASAPEVPSFTCTTSLEFRTHDTMGARIAGLATNSLPTVTCQTNAARMLYSVRNVTLSPSLSNYPAGTDVTCSAKGHPSPTYKWQELENDGTWKDVTISRSSEFSLGYVGSRRYRCIASNVVRNKAYNTTSVEIQFTNEDLTSSRTCASEGRLGIGVGIGLLVAILLTTVAFAILLRLRYLEFHSRPDIKSSDGGAQHMDHEMSSASHQLPAVHSSASRPKAPIPGEQESAYASLGDDRDVNEYASLEQNQK